MGGTHPQGAPLRQQRSLPQSTARGRCVSASALPHFEVSLTPPDLAEDVVLEASFARGLAAAECFEVLHPPGPLCISYTLPASTCEPAYNGAQCNKFLLLAILGVLVYEAMHAAPGGMGTSCNSLGSSSKSPDDVRPCCSFTGR